MQKERSYVMFKPEFTTVKIMQDVMERISEIGGRFSDIRVMHLSDESLDEHYSHLKDRFDDQGVNILDKVKLYMKSGIVVGCIVEGELGIVSKIRKITGPTKNAPAGTIRGDYAIDGTKNVIHASDIEENPEGEIERFFKRDKELGVEVLAAYSGKEVNNFINDFAIIFEANSRLK